MVFLLMFLVSFALRNVHSDTSLGRFVCKGCLKNMFELFSVMFSTRYGLPVSHDK